MVDEDLKLDLVLDPEHLPQLLHHLLPVLVRAEGGPRRAEGGLGQVRLCEAPGLQQLEFLERRKKNIGIRERIKIGGRKDLKIRKED